MRKRYNKIIGLLLAIVLCCSIAPIPALAANDMPTATEPVSTEAPMPEESAEPEPEESAPPTEPDNTETPAPPEESIPPTEPEESAPPAEPSVTPTPAMPEENTEPEEAENIEPTWPEVSPEYVKTVNKPLVKVVYHYYDEAVSVTDFADYAIASSHSYYALAFANGENITIAANKYPGKVSVSTEVLRFRVLLNGETDVTGLASYDANTGIISLPSEYMGHNITVVWYCPASEITELPVKVTASVYKNGEFTTSTTEISLASNANTISVPFTEANALVVSQNGIDLDMSAYSASGGNLNISASALGGDIAVTAYAPAMRAMRGASTKGATTRVVHTRSSEQIYYGYYTSYYTANGNTAFCLDPTVSGLNAGTYDVSGYLSRGTGYDDLIKAAYYLYGGPGYNGVKNNLFENPDSMEAYGLSHAAASYMWMDDDDAFKGLNSGTIQHLMRVIASVNAQPMPPASFEVFLYNVGSNTNQSLMSWEYTPTGNLEIQKVSGDPAKTDGNPCYSLAGAVFDVYNGSNQKIGSITTDTNGRGKLEGIAAGQSGLYIVEITPPKGYAERKDRIPFEIVSGRTTTVTVTNNPQGDPVTILLRKQDGETNTNTAQGSASLAGAQFTIRYYKGLYTKNELNGKTLARTWIVETDADGFTMLHPDFVVPGSDPLYYASNGTTPTIPLGTVSIVESKSPAGYLLNDEVFIRQITISGRMEPVNTYNAPIVPDEVIRGGVSVQKWDYELDRPVPQGDADLKATFDIYNRSKGSVKVNGTLYAPGEIVYTMTTDATTGAASTTADLLPYGDYEVAERPGNQPKGYLNTGKTSQKFSIRRNGVVVDLKTNAGAIKNRVIRGGVYIEKWDNELDENKAQGAGTLDVTVEIVNIGESPVLVDGTEYAPGEVVHTMTLSKEGQGSTPNYYLPYSTYLARETAVSEGYLATGVLTRTFEIRSHGIMVKLNTTDTALKNNPIRGDLKGVKIADGNAKRLAGVPFEIRSLTTGEAHIIVTDKNGELNTASSWNPHSQNTNRGETDRDGVWFGSLDTLNDDVGALLYDDYRITELPCAANEDMKLLTFDVSVYRHNVTVDLGTMTDDYVKKPEVFTTARDKATDEGSAYVSKTTTIIDTVYYSGLTVGRDYTVKGVLMDSETGEALLIGEKQITAEQTFKALSETGSVATEFTFDSLALAGKSLVVFEELYDADETLIAEHKDIADEGQTVTFLTPKLRTIATGADEAKQLYIRPETVIYDVVEYSSLIPGKSYTLKGVLMDKAENAPLLIDGKQVEVEQAFVPETSDGSVTIEFELDSLGLAGKTVVVFEELYFNGQLLGEHKDIDDEGQSVEFLTPAIGTSATGADNGKKIPAVENAKVIDTVTYENLAVNESYTLTGVLMDKETGKPVLVNGKEVTAKTQFTTENQTGSVTVEFVFDSRGLQGKELVVFETLTHTETETEIAQHADIDDKAQAVSVDIPKKPGNGTGAKTGRDGLPLWLLIVAGSAAAGALILALYIRKREKQKRGK